MKTTRALLLLMMVLMPLYALARPGGGQSYHAAPSHSSSSSHSYSTGSSHSYSTGGGSGGSMSPGAALTLLVILGVIVVIVMITKKRGGDRASVMVDSSTAAEGLAALRGQDPAFDDAAFAERAKGVMAKVNEAWIAGAMGPARRHISDGVYVRFQTQLQLLKAQGLRNAMADWSVVGCEVLAAESDAKWDTVHVKMVGQARDADVPANLSAQQAMEKAKHAPLVRYEEVWSFLRKRGSKSKDGVPTLEGRCPNCGADMPVSDVVRCEYCKAVVNSGEHDWVLAEITQPEEWRPWMTNAEIGGLAELTAKDPAVSRQELEEVTAVHAGHETEVAAARQRLLLLGLTAEEVGRLADEVDLPAGRVLMRQGDVGREFYVIIDGEVELERDGAFLRTMGAGEFFGDISLITERPRTATVTVAKDARFLVLGHREFHSLLDQFPSIRMGVLESVANRLRSLEPDSVG